MSLTQAQCDAFHDYLGRRPYPWDKKLSQDRYPHSYIYLGMYKTEKWTPFTEDQHLWEKVHVGRANDVGMWGQFFADPCLGAPCQTNTRYIGHGITQARFGHFKQDYRTSVFCLDQLKTIEMAREKLDIIVKGYKKVPEEVAGSFIRQLSLRQAGTTAEHGGLYLTGVKDGYGNSVPISIDDTMFSIHPGGGYAGTTNGLFINLNASGGLDTLVTAGYISEAKTAGLAAKMGQMTMEYLLNQQIDLQAEGYFDSSYSVGKFEVTMDRECGRLMQAANPALAQFYKAPDFLKGGAFYGLGAYSGCGDWIFKDDPEQHRFNWRSDLDGKGLTSGSVTRAVWIELIQPYENVAATYGIKQMVNPRYKAAPIRFYHAFNRAARTMYVGDITSVNSEMKFGLARSFMGKWGWHAPEGLFKATDPNTGSECTYDNIKRNMGFFLGEYDIGAKTEYPNIERWMMALGEPTPYVRRPNSVTAATAPATYLDYQSVVGYNANCSTNGVDIWGDDALAESLEDQ